MVGLPHCLSLQGLLPEEPRSAHGDFLEVISRSSAQPQQNTCPGALGALWEAGMSCFARLLLRAMVFTLALLGDLLSMSWMEIPLRAQCSRPKLPGCHCCSFDGFFQRFLPVGSFHWENRDCSSFYAGAIALCTGGKK